MSIKQDKVQVTVVVDGKQGINELGKLEMEANDLRHTMQGLKRDSKEYAAVAEDYKRVKAEMADLREKIGLTGMTMKQMRQYARELQTEMDTAATKGTARYEELKNKVQQVNQAMAKQKADVAGTTSMWSKLSTEVKQFGMLAIGALGLQFLAQQVTNLISKGSKLSDELSDVQKTTGMTAKEVRALNSDLSKMDTRTSTSELRKIAAAAGQLGIAKESIEDFTVATDKLTVALGDEFKGGAEEVTKVMGGLRNIFSDVKTDKVDVDMLHIGNAINALGAAGAATGPVVADFANRIGGVGITMGLTSGQVLGLSATLQELNVSTERGGTAVVKILQKMASEPEKFAKVAGMAVSDFTKLVNTDLYAAFTKVTEGAGKTGSQATLLAATLNELGVDGAGASEVMAKLGGNTALLNDKVKLASTSLGETNSIMSEFATKNDNLAGKLEKLTKLLSGAFTNSAFNDMLEGMVDGLTKLFGLTSEAEELTEQFQKQKDAVTGLHQNIEPLLTRYEELRFKTNRTTAEQTELEKIIRLVGEAVPTAVTEFDAYGKALDINTGKARAFIVEQENMLQYINKKAITAQNKEIELLLSQHHRLQEQLESGRKSVRSKYSSIDGQPQMTEVELSQADIEQMTARLGELMEDIKGAETNLAKLMGRKTSAETEAEVQAAWDKVNGIAALAKKTAAGEITQTLGLIQEIDARIKLYTEQRDASRSKAEITRLTADIKEQQEIKQRLLGEYKDKEAAKDEKQQEKEHAEALKNFRALQALAMLEQGKLRQVDDDADQVALNQQDAHYDELIKKAQAFADDSKLTVQERREAMQAVDLLYDTKEEARENLRAEQAKKRAATRLKEESAMMLAEADLRVLLAARDKDENPEALEEALVARVETERDIELQNVKLTEQERQLIIADSEDKITAIRKASSDQQMDNILRGLQEFQNYAGQMMSLANSFAQQQEQRAMKNATAGKEQRLNILEKEFKEGKISKEAYEREKNRIEEIYDAKVRGLKAQAWERERQADAIQATIAGLVAATEALTAGPFAGPAMAVFVGALAAANVAAIMSQPTPAFAEGGYTAGEAAKLPYQNLSRSSGGLLPGGPFLATVNEVGREYFVPNYLLQQPQVAQSVEIIEAIRTGGQVPQTPAFAGGGYSSEEPGAYRPGAGGLVGGAIDTATAGALTGAINRLNANLENPAVVRAFVVLQDMQDATDQINTIKKLASN